MSEQIRTSTNQFEFERMKWMEKNDIQIAAVIWVYQTPIIQKDARDVANEWCTLEILMVYVIYLYLDLYFSRAGTLAINHCKRTIYESALTRLD